jgi:RNA polymerase sigma factor (sigma-70 family)
MVSSARFVAEWAEPGRASVALADDTELRRQIFSLVYRQMRSIAQKRSRDLDDLVQIAAERAIRGLPGFQGRAELSTWTYRICYLTLVSHERTLSRFLSRFVTKDELPDPPDPTPSVADHLERQERIERLRVALARLAPKRRAVVVLHDLEGLDIDEVAIIVGAKRNTVKSRLRDGHRQLAKLLKKDPYFGEAACRGGALGG